MKLTREPSQLSPSDSTPVLHCGARPSPYSPVRIIGVDSQQFHFSPLWVDKFYHTTLHVVISGWVGSILDYGADNSGSNPSHTFFLCARARKHQVYNGFGGHSYFLSSFITFKNESSVVGFSTWKSWKYTNILQHWRFVHCWNSREHVG
jgi:hypothetical protein